MSLLYPDEAAHLDVIGHLEEMRRRILLSLAVFILAAVVMFTQRGLLTGLMKRPLLNISAELIFITPAEAFLAYIKASLLAGFVVSFPFILYQAWLFFMPAVPGRVRSHLAIWAGSALLLFYAGISFCYFVILPAALKFLINFGRAFASPQLALGSYMSFFAMFVLICGAVFEIPVAIGLLTDIGMLNSGVLRSARKYALFFILIVAAVITPTQDVVNMMLFAVPMIVLYEAGILISWAIERSRKSM